MKISKRTREQAALICAIAASADMSLGRIYSDIAHRIGAPFIALTLAHEAWCVVRSAAREWTRTVDAEAEALLRTGWSPGDEP